MSFKLDSSNCSLIDDTTQCSVLAKLRRLKIEENLLIKNINKINPNENGEDCIDLPTIYSSDLKNDTEKMKNYFTEIKNMFSDIKAITEEKLNCIDIENMKRDVLKLDDKIRNFKSHLQFELTSTTTKEEELIKQLNNVEEKQLKCVFKAKTRMKQSNHIVPSPVKAIIHSPFKCKEVQQFQEFMTSSPNRYGGWNEYHHNVFVNIWHKYFNSRDNNDSDEFSIEDHDQFQAFQKEIMQKISGSTKNDIITHCKWYCKYLYLKEQQQNALNNWKRTKKVLSKSEYTRSIADNDIRNADNSKLCGESKKDVGEILDTIETSEAEEIANALCAMSLQDCGISYDMEIDINTGDDDGTSSGHTVAQKRRSFSNVQKPTKQWINRCNTSRENVNGYNDLDTIKKLRIPEWRQILQD